MEGACITTLDSKSDRSEDNQSLVVLDRIPIEGWGQPIYSLTGTIQNAIFVFQDTISQQKAWNERLQLTCELEMKNQELQEADRLKDEFLKQGAVIALRHTPFRIMIIAIDLVVGGGPGAM